MIKLLHGDCRDVLPTLADGSVHACITSPPYFALRSYLAADHPDKAREIGSEATPESYIATMVGVFREVRRVLRADGVCFVNLGDSMSAGGNGPGSGKQLTNVGSNMPPKSTPGLPAKNLLMMPARLAIALQAPYEVPTCVKLETDRAWLAAMMDGEGTFGIRRYDSARLKQNQEYQDGFVAFSSVTNSDIELLDRCVEITGFGRPAIKWGGQAGTEDKRGIITRRDSYGWRLDGNAAIDVVRASYPYLIAKRRQACILYTLDLLNKTGRAARGNGPVPKETQEKKALLWDLVKRCNQREAVDLPGWIETPKPKIEPGWYLRSMMPWLKRSAMPESTRDRPASAVEYVFLLTKQARYFWDAEAVRRASSSPEQDAHNQRYAKQYAAYDDRTGSTGQPGNVNNVGIHSRPGPGGRNMRNTDLFYDSLEDAPEPAVDASGVTGKSWHDHQNDKVRGQRGGASAYHGAERKAYEARTGYVNKPAPEPLGLICSADGNPLALDVNPAAFSAAHFATFPAKLVEPLIRAGTSEKGCCSKCGAQWCRVVERMDTECASAKGSRFDVGKTGTRDGGDRTQSGVRYDKRSVGWAPSCDCWPSSSSSPSSIPSEYPQFGHSSSSSSHSQSASQRRQRIIGSPPGGDLSIVPCTVLDPFAGAGTTLLVADRLQRDAIGIELSGDYTSMSRERLVDDLPLFAEVAQ